MKRRPARPVEFGQQTSITRGNGSTTNYSYDTRGRLTNLVTVDARGTKIQNVTYDFNTDNSIAAKEDNTGEAEAARKVRYEYSYDGLNRLVDAQGMQETGGNTERAKKYHHGYSYAANGNMLSKSIYDPSTNTVDDRWSYSYNNHAVSNINSTKTGNRFEMRYDPSGNMHYQADGLKKKTKEITYDSNNRITEVTDATGKVVGQYAYDDQGFRVRKEAAEIINGAETKVEVLYPSMYFAIEKQKTPSGEDIANTSYAVNNVYLNGVRVAASLPNGECQYYLTDQVDSVSLVTDDKAEIVNRFEYLPFGETWITEGNGKNRPKFNSQELDTETGFYFFNARYQDPEICRFVTADTIIPYEMETQSWNRYSYCRNNPIQYKDPTGHADGSSVLSSLQNPIMSYFISDGIRQSNAKHIEKNLQQAKGEQKRNNAAIACDSVGDKLIAQSQSAGSNPQGFVSFVSGSLLKYAATEIDSMSDSGGLSAVSPVGKVNNVSTIRKITDKVKQGIKDSSKKSQVVSDVLEESELLTKTKLGAGGKPQPYNIYDGQYVSPDITKRKGSRAAIGFSQGVAKGSANGLELPESTDKVIEKSRAYGEFFSTAVDFLGKIMGK